jgi:hypothetical protein
VRRREMVRKREEEPEEEPMMELRERIIDILNGLGVDPDDHEKGADEIMRAVAEDDLAQEEDEGDAA